MDFGFTAAEEAFRQEVREFIRQELPPGWKAGWEEEYTEEAFPFTREMARKLGAKGWLTLAWPKEYGGQGRSHIEQLIYYEETAYYGVPGTGMGIRGIDWVGPSLMLFGTEEQKKEHLPRIAAGGEFWCTAYSEPGTGSDLASLQCRAVARGGDYVVSGQKVWTSAAQVAEWCWLAVRTNPAVAKHKGITLLLVDMKSPGITVRSLLSPGYVHILNEVFFDEVKVPQRNRVGEENQGWYYLAVALDFERSGPAIRTTARAKRILDETLSYARETKNGKKTLAEELLVKHKLAEIAIGCEVGRWISYRVAWMQRKGQVPNYEASMAKVYTTELMQRTINMSLQILGLYGQLGENSRWTPLQGWLAQSYLLSPSETIAAGTSEIQRNIIATRGLSLPRE